MQENNPYTPPQSNSENTATPSTEPSKDKQLEGLSGGLAFVGLAIVIIMYYLFSLLGEINEAKGFHVILSTRFDGTIIKYNLVMLITTTILLLCLWFWISILYFLKKRLFKKAFIIVLILSTILQLIQAAIFVETLGITIAITKENLINLTFAAFILVPYTLSSKRVENTFVH